MTTNDGTRRARRRTRGSWARLGGFACALLLLLALPGVAWSTTIPGLGDRGAWAQIYADEGDQLAEVHWGFGSDPPVTQVTQQLFLSDGDGGLVGAGLGTVHLTDTNLPIDPNLDTALLPFGTYGVDSIGMEISLLLRGVPAELRMSDLTESISVWNDTDTIVYLNQVVKFSLGGDPEGDVLMGVGDSGFAVAEDDAGAVFEEVVAAVTSQELAGFDFFDLGDNSFLMQWEIGPGETLLLSKDKILYVVPEPGTAALSGLGLLGLAILGRRSRER